jgi:hypothetical protein
MCTLRHTAHITIIKQHRRLANDAHEHNPNVKFVIAQVSALHVAV